MLKIKLISFLLFTLCYTICVAQFHPLSDSSANNLKEKMIRLSDKDLELRVFKESHTQKVEIIFDELHDRNASYTISILKEFILFHQNESSGWKNVEGKQRSKKLKHLELLALGKILSLGFESNSESKNFIVKLDSIIGIDTNPFLIDMVASRLGQIADNQSVEILKKYCSYRKVFEFNLFLIQTKGFSDEQMLDFIIKSVQGKIINSDLNNKPNLFTNEKSLFTMIQNITKILLSLEREKDDPTFVFELTPEEKNIYVQFIKGTIVSIQNRIKRNEIVKPEKKISDTAEIVKNNDSAKMVRIKRIEDQGESFDNKTTVELIQILKESNFKRVFDNYEANKIDIANLRKIARKLGDLNVIDSFDINSEDRKIINNTVKKYIELAITGDQRYFSEAKQQMYRFWTLAVPSLLHALESEKYFNFAGQTLNEMKSENIIKQIISKAFQTTDRNKKIKYYRLLKMMKNHYKIPAQHNRPALNKETIQRIYDSLVVPALGKLEKEIARG